MPLHPSVARIAASRANGARSKGPATARGKARASLNAVKHGLRGRRVVLRDDGERAAFAALLEGLEARCAPVDACERHWVHELATVMWRQQRLEALELAVLQQAGSDGEDGPRLPSLRTLCRYRARLARDWRAAFDALAGLRALRPRPVGDLEPAQLRWLADQAEAKRAAKAEATETSTPVRRLFPGTNEPGKNARDTARDTNEPGKNTRAAENGTNEPEKNIRTDRSDTNEPEPSAMPAAWRRDEADHDLDAFVPRPGRHDSALRRLVNRELRAAAALSLAL